MCGISGYIGQFSLVQGHSALSAMAHRGPDGQGEWLSEGDNVWLGHVRLGIIDPDNGHQPMGSPDGRFWVTFNGCLYNFIELKKQLEARGHHFRTQTDTEVLLQAYIAYGQDCVNYFNGMFAFAIWDNHTKTLFCARDQVGIKPFYYRLDQRGFRFASEIKALLCFEDAPPSVDTESLQEYITFQILMGDKTLFSGIHKLLPGHRAIYKAAPVSLDIHRYWTLQHTQRPDISESQYTDQLRDLLTDALRLRLRSDVPLGAHLSGGLDSSVVVGLTRRLLGQDAVINTFTGAFAEGSEFDETPYARVVAKAFATENHEHYFTAEAFIQTLPDIIYHMDEPAAGPGVFPQYLVSREAAKHVKVVLGGQGGDELFAGYARYLICYLGNTLEGCVDSDHPERYVTQLTSLAPHLPMLKQYHPMLKQFMAEGLFETPEDRYYRLMDRSHNSREFFHASLFQDAQLLRQRFSKIFNGSSATDVLDQMLYFDLNVHLPGLLHVEDRTSMAWGLESRVPLLDHRIVELMASVPASIKFKGGEPKYLFKQAVQNWLPPEILNRSDKMGFPVPLNQWLKTSLKPFIQEILLDERTRQRGLFNTQALEKSLRDEGTFGRAIWGALCLELWYRTFLDPSVNTKKKNQAIPVCFR